MRRALAAEAIGSLLLATSVIGSGVMAERLAGGNTAIALLANTGATVAMLVLLISLFAPISGAHFNPAVSIAAAVHGSLSWKKAAAYITAQTLGCCLGALLVHAMFELPLFQLSTTERSGAARYLAELVATTGLVLVVFGNRIPSSTPWLVAAWIGSAYWFTSSTSFANPAITIARSLSDTFSGIQPIDVPWFIAAQLAGAALGLMLTAFLGLRSESALT